MHTISQEEHCGCEDALLGSVKRQFKDRRCIYNLECETNSQCMHLLCSEIHPHANIYMQPDTQVSLSILFSRPTT